MNSRTIRCALCALVLGILLPPQAADAQCTLASFAGTYSYSVTGVPGFTYGSGSGTLVADGAGHFTNVITDYSSSFPNPAFIIVNQAHTTGTYQINSDCTGTLTFHPGPAGQLIETWVQIVLVSSLTEFFGVGVDQGDLEGYTGTRH